MTWIFALLAYHGHQLFMAVGCGTCAYWWFRALFQVVAWGAAAHAFLMFVLYINVRYLYRHFTRERTPQ